MDTMITGSSGFVGKHLVNRLGDLNYNVAQIDKKMGININNGGIQRVANDFKGNLEMIVHLAANCSTSNSIDDPESDFDDNVRATFQVGELARKLQIPIIFTSSCKVHPNPEGARAPYGLSKYVGELYLQEYDLIYGVKSIINRPGTIYGPGQEGSPESGWLSWFIKAKKENLPITIFGDGKQSRDVLFIDDYINLLVDQIQNFNLYARSKPYEVGGGLENEITLLQGLDLLKYSNYTFSEERKGDVKRFVADNTGVSNINGWKPLVPYQKGLIKTLDSYTGSLE